MNMQFSCVWGGPEYRSTAPLLPRPHRSGRRAAWPRPWPRLGAGGQLPFSPDCCQHLPVVLSGRQQRSISTQALF